MSGQHHTRSLYPRKDHGTRRGGGWVNPPQRQSRRFAEKIIMYHIYSPLSYTFTFHLKPALFEERSNTNDKSSVSLWQNGFQLLSVAILLAYFASQNVCNRCVSVRPTNYNSWMIFSYMGRILQLNLLVWANSDLRQYQNSIPALSSEVHSTDVSKEAGNPEGYCGLAQPLHHNILFFVIYCMTSVYRAVECGWKDDSRMTNNRKQFGRKQSWGCQQNSL